MVLVLSDSYTNTRSESSTLWYVMSNSFSQFIGSWMVLRLTVIKQILHTGLNALLVNQMGGYTRYLARHATEERLRDEVSPLHERWSLGMKLFWRTFWNFNSCQTSAWAVCFVYSLWSVHDIVCLKKTFNGHAKRLYSSRLLWERAKEPLRKEDCERLKPSWWRRSRLGRTRSLEGLCSDLLKIVSSRSRVEILREVRRCLPNNQRNKFTHHCNELLKTVRERGDLEK